MKPAATAPHSRRRDLLMLVLILGAGMAVRTWYLDWQLDGQRFWDERFSFQNVLAVLRTGTLEPASGYYPLLSYLPQALLLAASDGLHRLTGAAWLAVQNGDHFTAHAYRLARLVEALWGGAALWLTFLVGRRLFSTAAGLIAATALAFSPWHIHASAVFKPDAPLVAAVLLAFYWSLAAARRPTVRGYALAGSGVALALSMKLTGGLAALPLALDSLAAGRREPRRLALLALAGGVALALFLLLNPYWPVYVDFLGRNMEIYELKAEALEMSRWQAPPRIVEFLLQDLGVASALAAAIAAGVLAVRLARRRLAPAERSGVALLLLLPPTWLAGYMAVTEQFKANNFLPLLPFAAILAAWGLYEAWRWLARREPAARRRRWLGAAAILLLLAALVPRGVTYVYRSLTPTTEDLALRFAGRRMAGLRNCQLVFEPQPALWPRWERAQPFAGCHLWRVDRLTDLDLDQLRAADGILFPGRRLGGDAAAFYLAAVAASEPDQTVAYAPAAFLVRGPATMAALHAWAPRAPERILPLRARKTGEFQLEADLPAELEPGEVFSFSLWLPPRALAEGMPAPRLKTGGRLVELRPAGDHDGGWVYVSARLINSRPGPRVRVNRSRLGYPGGDVRLTLWRWRRQVGAPTRYGGEPAVAAAPGSG